MVDSASRNEILSFMDEYYSYNQIFIAEDDVSKTAFRCPRALGTYEWVVMPFGLKNTSATYQRAMNAIFNEFIGKFMEVYINDVVVKSNKKDTHLNHLRKAFKKMRKHGLKMNPLNCALGVTVGNFFGFITHNKEIAINQNKAKAILEASPPNKKQL